MIADVRKKYDSQKRQCFSNFALPCFSLNPTAGFRLKDQKEVGGITVFQETPAWLAFLKKRDDGRYEPVTDPYDTVDSFRELHQSSFFVPSK